MNHSVVMDQQVSVHSQELHDMCVEHFNEPMISFEEICRCIGYAETAIDCYILTRKKGGAIVWNTCVGGYTWLNRLRGQGYVKAHNGEDWDDLTRIDGGLTRGDCPKEPEFLLILQHDDFETSLPAQ